MRIRKVFATSTSISRYRATGTWVYPLLAVVLIALVGCSPPDDVETTTPSTVSTDSTTGRERPPSPSEEELAPRRQLLYRECDGGDDAACTELATLVDQDTEEYMFAVTCGGREEEPVCAPDQEG
jgi:hypothetical protein